MKKSVWFAAAACAAVALVMAQDITIHVTKEGARPKFAVPELRGDAQAQPVMAAFNETLWSDLKGAGLFDLVAKTLYPKSIPQQPSDWRQPPAPTAVRGREQAQPQPVNGGGAYVTDWSGPPVSANYMTFGYTAVQGNLMVLYGNLWDLARGTQVISKRYAANKADEAGARDLAHQFASDILTTFGATPISASHIYFTSSRTGHKEIWAMDADGKNQRQLTRYGSITIQPAVSPEGAKIAFVSYTRGNPGIFVFSVDPLRDLRYYNQRASVNSSPSFTPDGKQVIYSSSAPNDKCCRIYVAGLDGAGLHAITSGGWIDTEPRVNPKTGAEVAFVSGRSGPQQIYRMNMEGANVERLTPGEGEASNPSWHPNGQILAYAWTRGFSTGAFNIFTMDVATGKYNQLTHGEGKNENPSWAPDGIHLVFMSTRSGSKQIYTMLADGTDVRQLTNQGSNETPVWGK